MDRLGILKGIADEVNRGELIFPTNVTAALKLQQTLDDPDCHLETAIKLVLTEPLISARIVAIGNSVAYNRFGGQVTNVRAAVNLLGFRTLRSLVTAVVIRQFEGQIVNPALRAKAAQLWVHSAHVAALAQVIARRVTHVDPDTAMFAGIVHEVGGFYLLSRADNFPGLLDDAPEDSAEYSELVIGSGVLKRLMVPKPVMAAVETLSQDSEKLLPETLAGTLQIANELAPVASPLYHRAEVNSKQTTIIGDIMRTTILEESAEEVKSLTEALLL